MKQIPCPSFTPLQANSVTAENAKHSVPVTASPGAKEQIKTEGGGEKGKEKNEKKGNFDR